MEMKFTVPKLKVECAKEVCLLYMYLVSNFFLSQHVWRQLTYGLLDNRKYLRIKLL